MLHPKKWWPDSDLHIWNIPEPGSRLDRRAFWGKRMPMVYVIQALGPLKNPWFIREEFETNQYAKKMVLEDVFLHLGLFWGFNVGRYSSTMEHLGKELGSPRWASHSFCRGRIHVFSLFHGYPLVIKHGNGKSSINEGLSRRIIRKQCIFHCCAWLLDGIYIEAKLLSMIAHIPAFVPGSWNLTDQDAVDELVHLFELDERLDRVKVGQHLSDEKCQWYLSDFSNILWCGKTR